MAGRVFAAVDVGASGGRIFAGFVDRGRIFLEPVHRFTNGLTPGGGHLRWDITRIYHEVRTGLAKVRGAESVGIDTWGVDYGLLDADDELLADPVSYRDGRTAKVIEGVHSLVSREELFSLSGVQFLPFNTLYQLVAEQHGPLWSRAARALMIPDLIAFWMTGSQRSELTVASTTGLLDVHQGQWSAELLRRLGIPGYLFPELQLPGEVRGRTADGTVVMSVGSHDTASAVVGVPAGDEHFAFISCGTWALVGLELDRPVLTAEALRENFTNEAGVDGRVRFLRNAGGLWLLQECLRTWSSPDLDGLLVGAASLGSGGPTIDVGDAAFIAPGDMPARIAGAAGEPSMTPVETVRCVLDSLAFDWARTVDAAARIAGVRVEVIHLVGGGSRNDLLCRLTATATGLLVLAGPSEATAYGNVAVQARSLGALGASLDSIRASIALSSPPRRYDPA